MSAENTHKPDWFALTGAAITIGLHLLLQARAPNFYFITGACVFWIGYLFLRVWQDKKVLQEWGFRTTNFWPTAVIAAGIFLIAVTGFGVFAYFQGTLKFPLHAFLLLLLYPIWGLVQQFLALGIVVNNLALIPFLARHRIALVFLGAALFAVVHLHDYREMTGTFFLALTVIPVYLKYRNLWPLGVLHGWIGAFFYLWILDRDLFALH